MLARSLWFSLSFASSIICFISSALGWDADGPVGDALGPAFIDLVVTAEGGFVALGLAAVAGGFVALGLVAAAGGFVGLVACANAIDPATKRIVSVRDAVFMAGIVSKEGKGSQASERGKVESRN